MFYCLLFMSIFFFEVIITLFRQEATKPTIGKWLIVNFVVLLLAVIYFFYGIWVNETYANACINDGKKVETIIDKWSFPAERGFISWFVYDAKIIEQENGNISFVASDYYKKGDIVTCYVLQRPGKKVEVIAEGNKQCAKGNEVLSHSAVLWILTAIIYGLRHNLIDMGRD